MERETGIEPATNGLGSRDSTTELLPLIAKTTCTTLAPRGHLARQFHQEGVLYERCASFYVQYRTTQFIDGVYKRVPMSDRSRRLACR